MPITHWLEHQREKGGLSYLRKPRETVHGDPLGIEYLGRIDSQRDIPRLMPTRFRVKSAQLACYMSDGAVSRAASK
jgi:hypothetical protein